MIPAGRLVDLRVYTIRPPFTRDEDVTNGKPRLALGWKSPRRALGATEGQVTA